MDSAVGHPRRMKQVRESHQFARPGSVSTSPGRESSLESAGRACQELPSAPLPRAARRNHDAVEPRRRAPPRRPDACPRVPVPRRRACRPRQLASRSTYWSSSFDWPLASPHAHHSADAPRNHATGGSPSMCDISHVAGHSSNPLVTRKRVGVRCTQGGSKRSHDRIASPHTCLGSR